jgi:F-type H+-transporting ATPase subunit gamma
MQDLERAEDRLENIRAVRPILGALRTISMGSWQMALRRQKKMASYRARFLNVLPPVLAEIQERRARKFDGASSFDSVRESLAPVARKLANYRSRLLDVLPSGLTRIWERGAEANNISSAMERVVVMVIGSERGLCGRFNATLAEYVETYLDEHSHEGAGATEGAGVPADIELMALGSRLIRILQRRGERFEPPYTLSWTGELSATTLPAFDLAFDLTHHWLTQYEAEALDAVDVLYNAYEGSSEYTPSRVRLIPPEIPSLDPSAWDDTQTQQVDGDSIIVETDPLSLYARAIEQLTAIRFHELLLESAASEHATRYRLMESATQNADRLVDELTMRVQSARRQAITQEMQELAVGAGLLGSQEKT